MASSSYPYEPAASGRAAETAASPFLEEAAFDLAAYESPASASGAPEPRSERTLSVLEMDEAFEPEAENGRHDPAHDHHHTHETNAWRDESWDEAEAWEDEAGQDEAWSDAAEEDEAWADTYEDFEAWDDAGAAGSDPEAEAFAGPAYEVFDTESFEEETDQKELLKDEYWDEVDEDEAWADDDDIEVGESSDGESWEDEAWAETLPVEDETDELAEAYQQRLFTDELDIPETEEFEVDEEAEAAFEEEVVFQEESSPAAGPPPMQPAHAPRAVPPSNPVAFAPAPPTGSYWPVRSTHPRGREVAFEAEDGTPVGNSSRRFMARRSTKNRKGQVVRRHHVGIDLYANYDDAVVACADGVITNFYRFYGQTYALFVEHGDVVVNYGEVARDSLKRTGLRVGDRVRAGQVIGYIGRLPKGSSMLHFETYTPGTRRNHRWYWQRTPPPEILNPTRYLLFLQANGRVEGTDAPAAEPAEPVGGLGALARRVQLALRGGMWSLALGLSIMGGERDENKLTNLVFFARHPELNGRKIRRHERGLAREWLSIRDRLVRPALRATPRPSSSPTDPDPSVPAGSTGNDTTASTVHVKRVSGFESGVKVSTTARFRPTPQNPQDVTLAATGAAEGGFDTVNMYDRGILSWGLMQWTLHMGSLQKALAFIKAGLERQGQAALWTSLFPGLDVRRGQIIVRGTPITGNANLRRVFRGDARTGHYAFDTAAGWARLFARAGRHPAIQQLQTAYARQEIDRALGAHLGQRLGSLKQHTCPRQMKKKSRKYTWTYTCTRLTEPASTYRSRYGRIRDYVGDDLKATALFFGMWTNNRVGAYMHLKEAIDRLANRYGTPTPARWPHGWPRTLADEFETVLRATDFAYWGDAKARRKKRTSRTQKILNAVERLQRVAQH